MEWLGVAIFMVWLAAAAVAMLWYLHGEWPWQWTNKKQAEEREAMAKRIVKLEIQAAHRKLYGGDMSDAEASCLADQLVDHAAGQKSRPSAKDFREML